MDFDAAKKILRDKYIEKAGLELSDERPNELLFKYHEKDYLLRISEEDITEYSNFEERKPEYHLSPQECSICSKNYREHLIYHIQEVSQGTPAIFTTGFKPSFFGEKDDGNISAEISSPSKDFINYFRFSDHYLRILQRRIRRDSILDVNDIIYSDGLITIKVYNIHGHSIDEAITLSNKIIESCIFTLTYMKDIPLSLALSWDISNPRRKSFSFKEINNGNDFSRPYVSYNSDLIRFYQRGTWAKDPIIKFLSFYQILEYYFVDVTNEALYNKLCKIINDPVFIPSPEELSRLVSAVKTHDQDVNETEMLKMVLEKFVDECELIEFIRKYEDYLGDRLISKKQSVFGEDLEVKLHQGHTIPNTAKRIKIIRNALVHSTDRYEQKERFVPTIESERKIGIEVPLVKYLAERVIISSGKPI